MVGLCWLLKQHHFSSKDMTLLSVREKMAFDFDLLKLKKKKKLTCQEKKKYQGIISSLSVLPSSSSHAVWLTVLQLLSFEEENSVV